MPFPVLQDGKDAVGQTLFSRKGFKRPAVVPARAAIGSEPQVASPIFYNSFDLVIGQAVRDSDADGSAAVIPESSYTIRPEPQTSLSVFRYAPDLSPYSVEGFDLLTIVFVVPVHSICGTKPQTSLPVLQK